MLSYQVNHFKLMQLLAELFDRKQDFVSGELDCAIWASNVIMEVQQTFELPVIDYMQDFKGKYTTDEEGIALASQQGGLKEVITAKLGTPIPLLWAIDGCIVLKGTCIGFMLGRHVALKTDHEVLSTRLMPADTVWALPGVHKINE